MKAIWILSLLLLGSAWCRADGVSGPGRTTIQHFAWGSFYHEHTGVGAYDLATTRDGFRFTSDRGEVTIRVTGVNGYRFECGKDHLNLEQNLRDLKIHGAGGSWTLVSRNGTTTLAATVPRDTVVFSRNANTFTVKGAKGQVTVTSQFEKLRIESPLGTATVTSGSGHRTVAGIDPGRIPYLGRGLFIPFHGVGIFIDMAVVFPMPEVAEWAEWRPIELGP
jgi:hypothetical protein